MGLRVSCPDFVGRADELELLTSTFEAGLEGHTATVLIGGEAGVGKTRLIDEFCDQARRHGALVAAGGCVPIDGGGLAYGPIVGIVRDIVRQLGQAEADDALGALASGLGAIVPAVGVLPDMYTGGGSITEGAAKTRLFESVLAAAARLADRMPIVLVIEDLHWADSGTTELLSFLIRNLADAPVLLLATYRSEEVGRDHPLRPWLSELGRHGRVKSILLGALDREEIAALIGGILGEVPEWTLVDAVWGRSEGNAFFAEELVAARHNPSLSVELQGVILSRIDGLSDDAKLVLKVAATTDGSVPHDLMRTAAALDDDPLESALADAVDRQLLVVDAGEPAYRFRHNLLQEAVYGSLLPAERARLHAQVAWALVENPSFGPTEPGHRAAELAVHGFAAGEWEIALTESLVAADAATAVWALPESLVHLERALAALDRLSAGANPGVDRRQLLERTADAAYWAGESQRSVDLVQQAIEQADPAGDPLGVARSYVLLGRNAWSIGDSDAAFEAYRRAAALVPCDPPSALLAQVLAEEARGLMLMSRFVESEVRCHEGLAVARAVGARAEEGHLMCTLGCTRSSVGHHDEGIRLLRDALVIAEEVGSPDAVNRAYVGLTALLMDAGRLIECVALLYDAAAVGEDLWGVRLNGASGNCVEALAWLGRLDEAEALLTQIGEQGIGNCTAGPSTSRAGIALRRGRLDEAAVQLAIADELTAGLADVQIRGSFHLLRAELALARGDLDEAIEEVDRALSLAAATDDEQYPLEMFAMAVRCRADQYERAHASGRPFDLDKARLLSQGFQQEAERMIEAPRARGGSPTPRAAAFAAQCAAERSRLDTSDPDLWVLAASAWELASEPLAVSYCEWREAEARLEARSGRPRAEECLQEAWRTTVAIGAEPLTAKIEDLARRARVELCQPWADDPDPGSTLGDDLGLTPREVEVLGQLAAGRRDAEIAESLFISKKTASVHVSNILRKLEVANRFEAGKIGQAHGLGGSSQDVAVPR